MDKIVKSSIITALVLSFAIASANIAQGQLLQGQTRSDLIQNDQAFLEQAGLGNDPDRDTIGEVASEIIKIFLSLLGIIFVVLIIYAGFLWLTSAGNEEKITKSKKLIISAFIGLAIVLAAYAITYFVIDKILEATGTSSQGLD